MDICLIGGIYGATQEYRHIVRYTPEIILESGLRTRGHRVVTLSHYEPLPRAHFDIVHVHHLSWGALRTACASFDARFVFTMHAIQTASSTPALRRLAARIVLAAADAAIALSKHEAVHQKTMYRLNHAHQAVIPNGLDFSVFKPVVHKHEARQRLWRLLYVGQLIPLKRVDVLLRALSLCPHNIELNLVFHVDKLQGELKALASTLGLGSRVHFLGRKQPHELAQLYQHADVFVLPSASEALPGVITEAMACATPVIATCTGGIPEQVDSCGLLVPPGDADELARAIQYTLEHYPEYALKAELMALRVRERFSMEQMVDRHERLYLELLSRPTRRRHVPRLFDSCLSSLVEFACKRRREHSFRATHHQNRETENSR